MTEQPRQSTVHAVAGALMETSDVALILMQRLEPKDAAMAAAIGEMLGGAAMGLLEFHGLDQGEVGTIPVPEGRDLAWLRDVVEDTQRLITAYMQADEHNELDQEDLLVQDLLRWVNTAHALAVYWID